MSLERPTFSESWHRVADLRCRLRTGVRVVRQRYRGQVWHVLQDPAANQFFRLNQSAYSMLGMLDGRRTVAEAWELASAQWGDLAPTQGEVVQLLGQLYTSNLLSGDLPGDALSVIARRQKRIAREVRGQLSNLLFLRIPLVDPDAWLTRWRTMVDWMFSPLGAAIWIVMLVVGAVHLVGRERELLSGVSGVLAPTNLPYLYAVFVFIKLVHELGHAFACKCFGMRENAGALDAGAVRSMGVMLMVFMPVPYVDASSSWAFRNKSHRIIVALAGMLAELFLASIAAVIWARTSEGGLINALAFNAMITASVSTVLLNGNPLLRYDGYFILSELLDLPNLAQRANQYVQYLVKRYAWRVPRTFSPATSNAERAWFAVYAPASFVYRMIVFASIILFVSQQWFIVGVAFAVLGIITCLIVPAFRYVRYLCTSAELARVRARAIGTSAALTAVFVVATGLIPFPDHVRADGVIEPQAISIIHAGADGFVRSVSPSGTQATGVSSPLVTAENPVLIARIDELKADETRLQVSYRGALLEEPALATQLLAQLAAVRDQLSFAHRDLDALAVHPPIPGTWVSPDDDLLKGRFVSRGTPLGMVAGMQTMLARCAASQDVAARLIQTPAVAVEIRVNGRPAQLLSGRVLGDISPAGTHELPSSALGFSAGGNFETDPQDDKGQRSRQEFFEVFVILEPDSAVLPGQRVVARFRLADRSLAGQAWHELSQLFQRRFRI